MFNKIVVVEPVYIKKEGLEELKKYCKELKIYKTEAKSNDEKIKRIADADCILVSHKTVIDKDVLDNCPNLKFIHLCCSYYGPKFCKTDIEHATKKGIKFAYLKEYGDNGVVEYTIASVINLQHGVYGKKWRKETNDLTAIKVGILGLGDLGTKIAKAFNFFGTQVYYFSKTRKKELENKNLVYMPLDKLLQTVDVLSINLNRDVCLIGGDKLQIFGNNKIIVNTSIGQCYEAGSLKKWLRCKNNFYVCDTSNVNNNPELLKYENVFALDHDCGVTKETLDRATEQILGNIKANCKK